MLTYNVTYSPKCPVNNNVESVTWPCLFQLTTQLAGNANGTEGIVVSIKRYKLQPPAVVYVAQHSENNLN